MSVTIFVDRDFAGSNRQLATVRYNLSATAAAYDNGGFHLVEQFRYTVVARFWEFPQGTYPDRQVADPEDVAGASWPRRPGYGRRR
jgi:hypothetical protein